MKDWKAECEKLRNELKVAKSTIEQLQWRLGETESKLDKEHQEFREKFKETLLDLLR